MPGAAGARGAGYFYNVAPRDGSVFAAMAPAGPLFQRLRPAATGFRLDYTQLRWLGPETGVVHLAPAAVRHRGPPIPVEHTGPAPQGKSVRAARTAVWGASLRPLPPTSPPRSIRASSSPSGCC